MSRIAFLVAILLIPAAPSFAQDTARMEQVVQSFVSDGSFMGSVLVARGSDVVFSKGYGLANIDSKVSNSPTARFRVASITKQFTAASILLLQERGKLSVEDLVKKHLPNAPASWDTMTISHLLTHTAGFTGLQTPANQRGAPIESADGTTVEGFVARLMERPLESKPGETFNYTNSGYFVLGHLIQKISGQRYEQFVQDNIFTPLGMRDTGLDSPPVVERRASLYNASPKGLVIANTVDRILPNTAAGFYSTTEDLLRWQVGLYGGKVLSPASLQRMTTPFKGDYGFGVYIRTVDGRQAMTHGGGAPAFANLAYFPDNKVSVVVLGNINIAPAPEIAAFLGALAHGDRVQLASERKAITLAPDVLARYAGVYEVASGQAFIVKVDGAQLSAKPRGGNTLQLLAESETSFFIKGMNLRVEFIRDASGAVTEFVMHQGTRQDRARRTNEPVPAR
jgi:CubicO group peptidase (beta-lactamase class C family)